MIEDSRSLPLDDASWSPIRYFILTAILPRQRKVISPPEPSEDIRVTPEGPDKPGPQKSLDDPH